MAATLCVKLLPKQGWLPLVQSIRHGSKAVTRHRRPMHFLKQKLMAVTAYVPPVQDFPPDAYPSKKKTVQQESPLAVIKKRELKKLFQDYKMIAVLQNNSINAEDLMMLKYSLHKHDMAVKFYPNEVMQSFLNSSIYSNMAPLFIGQTVLIVSKEPKVKDMLRTLRSVSQITLLGGCVENTILSVEGLQKYSKLPTMTAAQGELVSGLTMMTSQTVSMLRQHPTHLSALLKQYVKQQNTDSSAEEAPKAEEAT